MPGKITELFQDEKVQWRKTFIQNLHEIFNNDALMVKAFSNSNYLKKNRRTWKDYTSSELEEALLAVDSDDTQIYQVRDFGRSKDKLIDIGFNVNDIHEMKRSVVLQLDASLLEASATNITMQENANGQYEVGPLSAAYASAGEKVPKDRKGNVDLDALGAIQSDSANFMGSELPKLAKPIFEYYLAKNKLSEQVDTLDKSTSEYAAAKTLYENLNEVHLAFATDHNFDTFQTNRFAALKTAQLTLYNDPKFAWIFSDLPTQAGLKRLDNNTIDNQVSSPLLLLGGVLLVIGAFITIIPIPVITQAIGGGLAALGMGILTGTVGLAFMFFGSKGNTSKEQKSLSEADAKADRPITEDSTLSSTGSMLRVMPSVAPAQSLLKENGIEASIEAPQGVSKIVKLDDAADDNISVSSRSFN